MKNICVFCASTSGKNPIYTETAKLLGRLFAKENIRLIYGGGNVGLMGLIADSVIENGGEVYGVIPDFLDKKEIAHKNLTQLFVVRSMHERKTKMFELSDAIIALPGGFGTMEELTEVLTWAQLNLHNKPIAVLNVNGYYNHLIALFDHMVSEGLLKHENREKLLISDSVSGLLGLIIKNLNSENDHFDKEKT